MIKRNFDSVNWIIAAAILLFFLVWLPMRAHAQDVEMCEVMPDGSILCCVTLPDGTEQCTSSITSQRKVYFPIMIQE